MPQRRAPARKWRTAHFVNLLENAIQHSAPGASIVINGEANDESTCCVRFADIGSGIASVDLPHVFERFYRSEWVGNRVLNPILRQLGIDKKLKAMGIKRCGNYAFRHMNATVIHVQQYGYLSILQNRLERNKNDGSTSKDALLTQVPTPC